MNLPGLACLTTKTKLRVISALVRQRLVPSFCLPLLSLLLLVSFLSVFYPSLVLLCFLLTSLSFQALPFASVFCSSEFVLVFLWSSPRFSAFSPILLCIFFALFSVSSSLSLSLSLSLVFSLRLCLLVFFSVFPFLSFLAFFLPALSHLLWL